MNRPKHTPGPWFVEADTDTIRHGERSADGLNPKSKEVKTFCDDEGLANAYLMAAAPELLDALRDLVREYERIAFSPSTTEAAHAAIRKAQGEEK